MNNVNNPSYKRVVRLLEQRSETILRKQQPVQMWVCPCSDLCCDGGCEVNNSLWKWKEREAGI